MKPEKGSHLPKLPSRSSRSENPAPPSNPSMALEAGGGTPTSGWPLQHIRAAQLHSVASSIPTGFLRADHCSLIPHVSLKPGTSTLRLLKHPSSPGLEKAHQSPGPHQDLLCHPLLSGEEKGSREGHTVLSGQAHPTTSKTL